MTTAVERAEAIAASVRKAIDIIVAANNELARLISEARDGQHDVSDVACLYFITKGAYSELDEATKSMYHPVDSLNKAILPKRFEDQGIDMLRVPSISRSFSVTTKWSASMVDKDGAFQWLRDTGNESLIQPTVNAGTLASFCKNMITEQGIEPPPELIKVSNYATISVNRYAPK